VIIRFNPVTIKVFVKSFCCYVSFGMSKGVFNIFVTTAVFKACIFPQRMQELMQLLFLPRPFPLGKDVVNMLQLRWWW
jgi:hypothetical protein